LRKGAHLVAQSRNGKAALQNVMDRSWRRMRKRIAIVIRGDGEGKTNSREVGKDEQRCSARALGCPM